MKMDVDLAKLAEIDEALKDKETAHVMIDRNKVISRNDIPGLRIETVEKEEGVDVRVVVEKGVKISKEVHMCFGVTHERALQKINMDVEVQDGAGVSILSHCIFPKAEEIKHIMEAKIRVGKNAEYIYTEKHIHAMEGGINVYPKAKVRVDDGGHFKTDFELIKGRVGILDIDYEVEAGKKSVVEMSTKVNGRGDDTIKVKEVAFLVGEKARGVLNSRIAVRNEARAEVYNRMVATAAYARGHVDCKEIIQDSASATAIPIVEVRHPKAHVTHEAAIGSVDTKQLQTLLARGLSEEEAVDLIVEGMLEG